MDTNADEIYVTRNSADHVGFHRFDPHSNLLERFLESDGLYLS